MKMPTLFRSSRSARGLAAATAAVACGLVLFVPGHGSTGTLPAPGAAACTVGPISVGDSLINAPTGGDKDFISIPPGPPNVMFLLGNNDTMQEYVTPLPTAGAAIGCTDPSLTNPATNPILNTYQPSSSDPALNGSVAYDPDPDFRVGTDSFFDPNKYYISYHNRLPLIGRRL